MNAIESKASDSKASVLFIENAPERLYLLTKRLQKSGIDVTIVQSGENALQVIEEWVPEMILLNIQLQGIDGFETCRRLKQHEVTRNVPIFFMVTTTEVVDKIKCLTVGSLGYLIKPIQYEEVLMHINIHISFFRQQKNLLQQNEQLKQEIRRLKLSENTSSIAETQASHQPKLETSNIPTLIGQSQSIIKILTDISRLQNINKTNILILGESGTGKELVAHAIHYGGKRAKGPFIPINCSAIPQTLAESKFFGHVRGAFTGALNSKGCFELAEGGTLFLDEIGEMPMSLQTKLLRVLEDRMIMPIGGEHFKSINIRIIAATNANLLEKIQAGTFRKDLYFRLAGYCITIPPLREHKEDIILLVDHFLIMLAREMEYMKTVLSQSTLAILKNYDFPGNVRELKNILERALICSEGKTIQPQHLNFEETKFISNTLLPELSQSINAFSSIKTTKLPSTDEEKILASVQKKGHINNTQCRQLLSVCYNRASYLLRKMNRAGTLVREGSQRSATYRLP